MPILSISTVSAGSALSLRLASPITARSVRLLRNTTGIFSGHNDPSASVVLSGAAQTSVMDDGALDGATYHYQLYSFDGAAWVADGAVVSATPSATFQPVGVDPLSMVRDRLDLGLEVMRLRGVLTHDSGHIPVMTAPPIFEDVKLPVVTVHLTQDAPQERGIGEMPMVDEYDYEVGKWESHEGWLSGVQLTIVGWALNPDERIALRLAIKAVLIANLSVFDAAGVQQVEVQQTDNEDFQSYGAPVYQVMTTFRCIAPSVVSMPDMAITDVTVTPTVI